MTSTLLFSMSELPTKLDCYNGQCLIAEGTEIPITEIIGLEVPNDPAIVAILQDTTGTAREITGFRGNAFGGDGITRQVVSVPCADFAKSRLISSAGLKGYFDGHQVVVTPEFEVEQSWRK